MQSQSSISSFLVDVPHDVEDGAQAGEDELRGRHAAPHRLALVFHGRRQIFMVEFFVTESGEQQCYFFIWTIFTFYVVTNKSKIL